MGERETLVATREFLSVPIPTAEVPLLHGVTVSVLNIPYGTIIMIKFYDCNGLVRTSLASSC